MVSKIEIIYVNTNSSTNSNKIKLNIYLLIICCLPKAKKLLNFYHLDQLIIAFDVILHVLLYLSLKT